jgi:WD40 repeat protein
VQICSNHLEVVYLSVKNGEKLENSEPLIFNEIWETWTSRAGWHVEKIFDDISDFSFIKTVTRSWSCKFLALGKDLGEVQISSFPYRPGCQERVYTGHSSKIHNLKWTKSDDYLLSCSSDRLIIQWKVEK